ncbi:NADH dehydrogenase [ubiquinone] 1 beta subcomplex subunit 2, mitochondrial-like [Anthonomus grandis grandis]|uniref:NADH dehydrogenase [ubiquinone] 1 beta subcomplex subunit 2, mitochondrial-like n=1 Tax=Anthonomus grandis grandis TaxID=2921223 RepID=UPI0021657A49|nr:NADH dehydrogenase [ubiquinone] 1 beta subcomplex subunit 2, mitochondrial-like [Anthonomus grandis grandis]XP_050295905.1 NADH dehydrogenase [ubiquinone] 1 beta subcomplex subunit 2, mitochondrial-like [Anthonomus grandis grandis]XP_050295906.1 NADH dehydrogenase [ubiquinone] 1 beta subcomplex subunit 2, mitochondrial-like [Anthonomus grandis grandis]XP_050295907.1 NADH dehydrogenase [ubiquinone] 1 beta subcomplex subunit 2, mitochondrial-like [Anthonomus grandis grandis]
MLASRGFTLFRAARSLAKNTPQVKQAIRNHGSWNYRTAPPPNEKNIELTAEIVQGVMWWWMLWHLWTEPDHILGEFEYPDGRKWTDQELGIPEELECD